MLVESPTVNHKIQTRPTLATAPAVALPGVGRIRAVYHPEVGKFFRGLRDKRGWSQRQAVEIARRREIPSVTRQILIRLERGQTKNPEPEVLRGVAALYEMPYEELAGRFVAHRYGVSVVIPGAEASAATTLNRDLPRQSDGVKRADADIPPATARGSHAPDATTRSLLKTVARLVLQSEELAAIADELLHAATGRQTPTPRGAQPSRAPRDRKPRRHTA